MMYASTCMKLVGVHGIQARIHGGGSKVYKPLLPKAIGLKNLKRCT